MNGGLDQVIKNLNQLFFSYLNLNNLLYFCYSSYPKNHAKTNPLAHTPSDEAYLAWIFLMEPLPPTTW